MQNRILAQDIAEIADTIDADKLCGKVVLIAGAAGFLPAYLVETILFLNRSQQCNCRVIAVVRDAAKAKKRFSFHQNRPDLTIVTSDVCNLPSNLPKADIIIHAASPASPKHYGVDPVGVMRANFIGMHNLLELARIWKSESFLYFSSGEVYGQLPVGTATSKENEYGYIDVLNVRSCYAESKRAAETLGVSYWTQYGVPCKIVRPFHTYGPGMALDDGRVFADFVADIINNRDITMKSDGSAIRAFCYLADAARAFFTIMLHGIPGHAYNVGNPEGALSIAELAHLLVGLYPERELKVIQKNVPTDMDYLQSPIARNVPNIEALKKLGWTPRYSPREGFLRTINSYQLI